MPTAPERSYRALLAVPAIGRVLAGMLVSRIADGMTAIALVLFTLQEFGNPALAGFVTFVSIVPGLLVSPLAGALLDRHGRTRLIVLDLLVAASALWLIASLATAGALTAPLLVLIVFASSITGPLSRTGLRSLFPVIVPKHLWERANAIDANGYVVATLIGPPAAAALVQFLGGPTALALIGLVFALAAFILRRAPDPPMETVTSGSLAGTPGTGSSTWPQSDVADTRHLDVHAQHRRGHRRARRATSRPRTARRHRVDGRPRVRGAGCRRDRRGAALRTCRYTWPRADDPVAVHARHGRGARAAGDPSIAAIALCMGFLGFFNGPMDVALFTVRQRRTDPAWTGRAFAVSMSLNFAGYPVGSLIAGALGVEHLPAALAIAVVATLLGALMAWAWTPARAPEPGVTSSDASLRASAG